MSVKLNIAATHSPTHCLSGCSGHTKKTRRGGLALLSALCLPRCPSRQSTVVTVQRISGWVRSKRFRYRVINVIHITRTVLYCALYVQQTNEQGETRSLKTMYASQSIACYLSSYHDTDEREDPPRLRMPE